MRFVFAAIIVSLIGSAHLHSSGEISGKTNKELFNKYRCLLCQDIILDNIELIDGELVVNEKVGINFCENFFKTVLHNSIGGIVCHTVVQAKLDEVIKKYMNFDSAEKISNMLCNRIKFCDK